MKYDKKVVKPDKKVDKVDKKAIKDRGTLGVVAPKVWVKLLEDAKK